MRSRATWTERSSSAETTLGLEGLHEFFVLQDFTNARRRAAPRKVRRALLRQDSHSFPARGERGRVGTSDAEGNDEEQQISERDEPLPQISGTFQERVRRKHACLGHPSQTHFLRMLLACARLEITLSARFDPHCLDDAELLCLPNLNVSGHVTTFQCSEPLCPRIWTMFARHSLALDCFTRHRATAGPSSTANSSAVANTGECSTRDSWGRSTSQRSLRATRWLGTDSS